MSVTDALLAQAPARLAAGDCQRLERDLAAYCQQRPDDARAHFLHGAALHALGRIADALESFQRSLLLAPDDIQAVSAHAAMLHELGRAEEAARAFAHATELAPDNADLYVNLATAFEELRRPDQALATYRQALALQPDHRRGLQNLAVLLNATGHLDEALAVCETLIRHHPGHADGHANHANLLLAQQQFEAALVASTRATELAPGLARAHADRYLALAALGHFELASAAARRAVALAPDVLRRPDAGDDAPDFPDPRVVYLLAGHDRLERCDWHDFDRQRQVFADLAVDERTRIGLADQMGLLFRSYVLPVEPMLRARLAMRTGQRIAAATDSRVWLSGRERRADDRIRIGYLSADYRLHPGAMLLLPALLGHDRTHFEISAYALNPDDGSELRARLRASVDRFVELHHLDDHEAAWRIHEAGCDLLVFREGYTHLARPGLLAHRPAPLQFTWAGYHGTLGGGLVDYHVGDPLSDPPGEASLWSESRLYLPYGPFPFPHTSLSPPDPPPRAGLGLPENALVFAAMHRGEKIDPPLFASWMRLLQAVPGSVLWLLEGASGMREALTGHAGKLGVDPARLLFAAKVQVSEHVRRLAAADIWLDTRWYGSHTTLLDAMAAALPAVTCTGNAVQGRIGASILTAAGLPEFVTHRLRDYEAVALRLAGDQELRQRVRQSLRSRRAPLFDTHAFVRTLEDAYRQVWRRHQRGLSVCDTSVSAAAYRERSP